jgi:hypothetical protein
MHRKLAAFNRSRLCPAMLCPDDDEAHRAAKCEHEARLVECAFVEHEQRRVQALVERAPKHPLGFMRWFQALEHEGPGQGDPLFSWLANVATNIEMQWFLSQEATGEVCWESLALTNLLVALAANRRYAYQSLGALGAIELTAPGRATKVDKGLKRLGFEGEARRYFVLHATIDIQPSRAWHRDAIASLVVERPECASMIAEGALMRLQADARCFASYRRELGLESVESSVESRSSAFGHCA